MFNKHPQQNRCGAEQSDTEEQRALYQARSYEMMDMMSYKYLQHSKHAK